MELLFFSIFLLFFSGLFSSSETSIFLLASKKSRQSFLVGKLLKKPIFLLNTILLGNMLVNILFSNLAETFLSKRIFTFSAYPELKILLVILSSTMVILIFGEVVPKNLGLHYPDQVSKVTAFFIYWISKAIYPVSFTFTKLTQFFINRWGEKSPETALSKYEIKSIIHLSYKRGLLRKEETELIEKIVNFSHMEIQNLMFPRKDLLALSLKEPMSRAWELMEKYGFGKILIYRDNIDHIVGFLHIRDFIKREWEPERPIQSYPYFLRDVHFIPETKGPIEVLKLLRAKKVSFGVVLDEYGGTAGIVTVNQIIKNIIGEYVKESPDKEDQLFITKENELIVNAHSVNLRHVKEWFRLEEEWNNEEETVASYVLRKLDKIPVEGETFQTRFLKWTVLVMKENSISKVGIKRR